MHLVKFAALYAFVGLVVYIVATQWLAKRRRGQEAARRGCLPAPALPRKGFLGLGRLVESIRATKAERGPQYVRDAMDNELGKNIHTCRVPISDYELMVTRDPTNVQAMLATQAHDWDVGEHRNESWKPLFGNGVFVSRGEAWKHSRALIRPQFARDQINDLDLFESHTQQLFKVLDDALDTTAESKGWTRQIDLLPLFYNLTLDTTTEFLYGYSVHSQNPSERVTLPTLPGLLAPDRAKIGHHMDAGKYWVETRGALWKYRWLLPTKDFNHHCNEVHKYVDWFVQLRLTQGEKYLSALPIQSITIDKQKFVLLHELAKETQSPVELRGETLNILTAGRDTTAALLGWVFYFLARHPSVFNKLRSAILDVFGPYNTTSTNAAPSSPINFKLLRDSLPYLTSVVNETFRVAPVVPLNERVALVDTTLPRGGGADGTAPVFVPKGQQVLIPTFAMQRREDIWGADVDEFRPERWEEGGGRKFGFEFIPFGGGVRQCLGQQFSRTEASYVIVRMLQRYDEFENMEPPGPMRFHHTIENRSGSGVQVKLHQAGH